MNKFNLTLDNLVYSLVVLENEDITFVLPKKLSTDNHSEDRNIFKAVVETTLKVFIRTKVSTTPKLDFIGQDEKQKIVMSGSLELLPDSLLAVTMTTVDGGNTWLVNSCNAASTTAEGAEKTAINAQELAMTANVVAETATTNAETAKQVAQDAQGKAENAQQVAGTASEFATRAVKQVTAIATVADEAKNNANTAVETAVEAKRVADGAEDKATETKEDLAVSVTKLEDMTKVLVKHITNLENSLFWIDEETLQSTRPAVDPDTLEKLPFTTV